jgi:hypothetical protein
MLIRYLACMALAAHFYGLPPRVLPSIQRVEGGNRGVIRADANGSADLGVMQVNTLWVEPVAVFSHLPRAVVYQRLVFDPCYNIFIAGAITKTYLIEAHGNLMRAIGFYHSHMPSLGDEYQRKVLQAARQLFQGGR